MDVSKLMGQMRDMQGKMQERMKEAQEKLGHVTTTAESGGGMVKVQVNGHRQVVGMSIDPDLLKPESKQLLQDLIMGATNKALEDIEVQIKETMQASTEGLMPNIPGMPGMDFNF